jgi:hypothetical protein
MSKDDVICGGSRIVKCHPGNQRYENIINQYLSEYKNASKKQRSEIISTIIDTIRNDSVNGGTFVQKDPISKTYITVPEHKAVSLEYYIGLSWCLSSDLNLCIICINFLTESSENGRHKLSVMHYMDNIVQVRCIRRIG